MKLTAREIAEIVQGKLHGSPDIVITGAAGLHEAGASDVSFVSNPKYIPHAAKTKAGLVLVPETAGPQKDKAVVAVKNAQLAFAQILTILDKELNPPPEPGIHPSAVVSPSAKLGSGVSVGPCAVIEAGASVGDNAVVSAQCYIGKNSKIGAGSLIYPGVIVRENVTIGSKVIVHAGTVIGADGFGFVGGKTGHYKIPQIGTVEIGDAVEIGANVTIDRATTGKTVIGKGTKIDNMVQIAHNVRIGEHCIIVSQVGIAGSTHIGNFVTIAGQAGTVGHITIGDGVTIAARSGVINDVPAGETVSGFPARPHREELKIQALIHKLPEIYQRIKKSDK